MRRLAKFDVSDLFEGRSAKLVARLAFGAGCAVLMIVARSAVDAVAPGAGPFALIFPAILLATLFGHWEAGIIAFIASFGWSWLMVLPPTGTFAVTNAGDAGRVILSGLSGLLVLLCAESFRSAVRVAAFERDREIEQSKMLRAELEHRVKNNLQMMASLLETQRRNERDPTVQRALAKAVGRVSSIAAAYAHLPVAHSTGDEVAMQPYLAQIVHDVGAAVLDDGVKVTSEIADIQLDRSTAMAIGLYANEALTNCAKHAFPAGHAGQVVVTLTGDAAGWQLEIRDDGAGRARSTPGKGSGLMDAFAKTAGAVHYVDAPEGGCAVRLVKR